MFPLRITLKPSNTIIDVHVDDAVLTLLPSHSYPHSVLEQEEFIIDIIQKLIRSNTYKHGDEDFYLCRVLEGDNPQTGCVQLSLLLGNPSGLQSVTIPLENTGTQDNETAAITPLKTTEKFHVWSAVKSTRDTFLYSYEQKRKEQIAAFNNATRMITVPISKAPIMRDFNIDEYATSEIVGEFADSAEAFRQIEERCDIFTRYSNEFTAMYKDINAKIAAKKAKKEFAVYNLKLMQLSNRLSVVRKDTKNILDSLIELKNSFPPKINPQFAMCQRARIKLNYIKERQAWALYQVACSCFEILQKESVNNPALRAEKIAFFNDAFDGIAYFDKQTTSMSHCEDAFRFFQRLNLQQIAARITALLAKYKASALQFGKSEQHSLIEKSLSQTNQAYRANTRLNINYDSISITRTLATKMNYVFVWDPQMTKLESSLESKIAAAKQEVRERSRVLQTMINPREPDIRAIAADFKRVTLQIQKHEQLLELKKTAHCLHRRAIKAGDVIREKKKMLAQIVKLYNNQSTDIKALIARDGYSFITEKYSLTSATGHAAHARLMHTFKEDLALIESALWSIVQVRSLDENNLQAQIETLMALVSDAEKAANRIDEMLKNYEALEAKSKRDLELLKSYQAIHQAINAASDKLSNAKKLKSSRMDKLAVLTEKSLTISDDQIGSINAKIMHLTKQLDDLSTDTIFKACNAMNAAVARMKLSEDKSLRDAQLAQIIIIPSNEGSKIKLREVDEAVLKYETELSRIDTKLEELNTAIDHALLPPSERPSNVLKSLEDTPALSTRNIVDVLSPSGTQIKVASNYTRPAPIKMTSSVIDVAPGDENKPSFIKRFFLKCLDTASLMVATSTLLMGLGFGAGFGVFFAPLTLGLSILCGGLIGMAVGVAAGLTMDLMAYFDRKRQDKERLTHRLPELEASLPKRKKIEIMLIIAQYTLQRDLDPDTKGDVAAAYNRVCLWAYNKAIPDKRQQSLDIKLFNKHRMAYDLRPELFRSVTPVADYARQTRIQP